MHELNPFSLWAGPEQGGPEKRAGRGWQGGRAVGAEEPGAAQGCLDAEGTSLAERGLDRRRVLWLGEPEAGGGGLGAPTCQLPVVQFEAAERVGAIEEHVPFGVHRL